jgi:hypothetical protein
MNLNSTILVLDTPHSSAAVADNGRGIPVAAVVAAAAAAADSAVRSICHPSQCCALPRGYSTGIFNISNKVCN